MRCGYLSVVHRTQCATTISLTRSAPCLSVRYGYFRPERLTSFNLLVTHGGDSALRVSQVTRNTFLTSLPIPIPHPHRSDPPPVTAHSSLVVLPSGRAPLLLVLPSSAVLPSAAPPRSPERRPSSSLPSAAPPRPSRGLPNRDFIDDRQARP
jgi:hypothetical protein